MKTGIFEGLKFHANSAVHFCASVTNIHYFYSFYGCHCSTWNNKLISFVWYLICFYKCNSLGIVHCKSLKTIHPVHPLPLGLAHILNIMFRLPPYVSMSINAFLLQYLVFFLAAAVLFVQYLKKPSHIEQRNNRFPYYDITFLLQ